MDFITRDQFPLFVLLVLPGFISTKVYELLVPGERADVGHRLLEAFTYGLLNFGLWYVVVSDILIPLRDRAPWVFRLGVVGVLVISPIALGVLANAVLRWPAIRRWVRHPVPTAWDYRFAKREPGWILVRLKSGLLIGGLFEKNSFASSYPHRDVYIEQVWQLDAEGRFLAPVGQSRGALLSMDDCQSIEFFAVADDAPQVIHAQRPESETDDSSTSGEAITRGD